MAGDGRVSKFHARPSTCNAGHRHASAKEARRCNGLHILQGVGQIRQLQIEPQFWFTINGEQVKHSNGRRVGFKPDFQYFEGERNVVEDVKGGKATRTEAYVLRVAIFRALYPFLDFREV